MHTPAWLESLTSHAARMADQGLRDLVHMRSAGVAGETLRVGPILACFARQRIDDQAWAALLDVARDRDMEGAIQALFDGVAVNQSERRPALHMALRSNLGEGAVAQQAHAQAQAARQTLARMIDELRDSKVTDLVNVGIGGSDLGPRLALEALRDLNPGRFRVHFLSTVDAHASEHLLPTLDPSRTAAILVSKSFGTQETQINGARLKQWLGSGDRLYAVSANVAKAQAFGVSSDRILPIWDWVGGRYSLWSSVGFVIAAALGMDVFERMLAGAAQMDAHVRQAPLAENLAVRHGLTAVWNRNAMGYVSQAILPYDERLSRLSAYLQQLVMESLGKSVTHAGAPVGCATGTVIWGGSGTDVQHSFFQELHQGTDTIPMDFIGVVRPDHDQHAAHAALLANLLAQAEGFANGAHPDDPQKVHPGNRPSTLFLLDALTPESFGALLALYEHSVFVQATIWGINPFDQWGVELGKVLANALLPAVTDGSLPVADPVTAALLAHIHGKAASRA
ncbi:MAG: glucose-6-phosphate isomerase [Xanthomonadales bacterium]|nr:glucose-6-phosphate isomerase [Xanthomonadales bacterium]